MQIQRVNPQTFDAASAIFITAYPDRRHEVDAWQTDDTRWIALSPDRKQVVGYATAWQTRATTFHMDLVVDPEWRRSGIGSSLLDVLVQHVQDNGANILHARARDRVPAALPFLLRHHFTETIRMTTLDLDMNSCGIDFDAYCRAVQLPEGISLTTLAREQGHDPLCWQHMADLHNAAREGWPNPEPGVIGKELTADDMQQYLERMHPLPEAMLIARTSQQYVGYCGLTLDQDAPTVARSVGTAVHPRNRNLGIATVLKLNSLAFARQHGITRLSTGSAHPAMLHINMKLGFQPGFTEVRLMRNLAMA